MVTLRRHFPSFSYSSIFQNALKRSIMLIFLLKIIQCFLWVISWRSSMIPCYGWVNIEIWFQPKDKFQSANINHIIDLFPLPLLSNPTRHQIRGWKSLHMIPHFSLHFFFFWLKSFLSWMPLSPNLGHLYNWFFLKLSNFDYYYFWGAMNGGFSGQSNKELFLESFI